MTNWSTEDLMYLKEMINHKVIYDGYEFVWMHKLYGEWNRHYVSNFEDYNKPMSWIHHNVYNWGKEYRQRHAKYLDDMRNQLDIDVKIREISREANIKTVLFEKIFHFCLNLFNWTTYYNQCLYYVKPL